MKRLAMIAALPGELKPLVQGWEQVPVAKGRMYRNRVEGLETVAVCCGIGREAAAQAVLYAVEDGALAAIVSIGWAGALSAKLQTAHVYTISTVVDAATGERYEAEQSESAIGAVKLVTARRIVLAGEKRQLAEDFGAMLVDMEAATVARLARVREIPFYCYKAVSDAVDELLPDLNPYLRRDGQMRTGALMASMMMKPKYWMALGRMGRNSSLGAKALAGAVTELQSEMSKDAHGN